MSAPANQSIDLQTYIGDFLNIYEIEIPGHARVFLAVNKTSIEEAKTQDEVLNTDTANPGETDPKKMVPLLFKHPSYGGTRLEPLDGKSIDAARKAAIQSIMGLGFGESHVKHVFINKAVDAAQGNGDVAKLFDTDGNLLHDLPAFLPGQPEIKVGTDAPGTHLDQRYFDLAFRGGRCVILPWDGEKEKILSQSSAADNPEVRAEFGEIFKEVGAFLNGKRTATRVDENGEPHEVESIPPGSLFLTPDFGPNRHLADWLHEHSPYVLGVNRRAGGGDGKAAYTVSGVLGGVDAAAEQGLWDKDKLDTPITLIGSSGAMGSDLINRLSFPIYNPNGTYGNVHVCDINYADDAHTSDLETVDIDGRTFKKIPLKEPRNMLDIEHMNGSDIRTAEWKVLDYQLIPEEWTVVPAKDKIFTEEALSNGNPAAGTKGLIITTSAGHEMENEGTNLKAIPAGTTVLLAQNWGLSLGGNALKIAKQLKERGSTVIQGQALTPGGAGNSKLEIFWRAMNGLTKDREGDIPDNKLFPKRLGHEIVTMLCRNGVRSILELARADDITTVEALAKITNIPAVASDTIKASTEVFAASGSPAKAEEVAKHAAK